MRDASVGEGSSSGPVLSVVCFSVGDTNQRPLTTGMTFEGAFP